VTAARAAVTSKTAADALQSPPARGLHMITPARVVRVASFVVALSITAACGDGQSALILPKASGQRFTPLPAVNAKLVAAERAREISQSTPTIVVNQTDVDAARSSMTPPTPPPNPNIPAIVSFDVVDATPISIDLAWQTNALSSCVLITNDDVADALSVGPNGSVTLTTATESGLRTYRLHCLAADSTPFDASRSVLWGDALSVQDVIGVRALVGNLTQQTTEFITDFDNTELLIVTGNFELDFDPLLGCAPVSVTLSSLMTIGANLILVDNAGVSRFSFPRLVTVGDGVDITGNTQLMTIYFPELTLMGKSSTFAAQQNPLLPCEQLASVYCALAQQGAAFVPDCPNIFPGCPLQ
jgi:hypothetical protein